MATRNKEFASDLMQAGVDVTGIGKSLTDVMPVVSQLSSEFGIGLQEATDISAKVFDTGIALGIADSEAAKLFGTFMQIGGLTGKQAEREFAKIYNDAKRILISIKMYKLSYLQSRSCINYCTIIPV